MSTAQLLGTAAPCHTIEWNGKVCKLSLISQYVKALFERKLYEADLRRLEAVRDRYTDDEYRAKEATFEQAYFDGEYGLLAPKTLGKLEKPEGAFTLICALTDGEWTEGELVGLLISKKDEVLSTLHRIIQESFPGLKLPSSPKAPGRS